MRLLQRAEIEDGKWDECVKSSPFFRHYALSAYLDATCRHWMGLTDEDYSFVWPLPYKKFPVKRVYQPLLAQQLGPFGKEISRKLVTEGLNYLSTHFAHVRIKFNEQVGKEGLEGNVIENQNFELDLSDAYSTQRYNRTVQSNLKKAEKANLTVMSNSDFDPWGIEVFKSSKGLEVEVLNDEYYKQVQEVYHRFSKGAAFCYTAFIQSDKVAQVYLLNANKRLLFLFSASNDSGKQHGAMHAIVDAIIKDYSGQGLVLDFEGSNSEGLAFFYVGFGAERKVYLQWTQSRLYWPLNKLIK